MICVGSKAMLAISIDLFTNISRNVQQTDMLIKCSGLARFLHQLNKRFALSPDEANEIIAIWAVMLYSQLWPRFKSVKKRRRNYRFVEQDFHHIFCAIFLSYILPDSSLQLDHVLETRPSRSLLTLCDKTKVLKSLYIWEVCLSMRSLLFHTRARVFRYVIYKQPVMVINKFSDLSSA